jgi:CspA family cold shock protein
MRRHSNRAAGNVNALVPGFGRGRFLNNGTQKMIHARVKVYYADRGFGFATRSDNAGDVFFHQTDVERAGLGELRQGDYIGFDLQEDHRTGKQKAVDLRLIERAKASA